jgi:hypothetical protein
VQGDTRGFGSRGKNHTVVPNRGNIFLRIEGKDHGVVEDGLAGKKRCGVPSESLLENRTGFHFPSGPEKLGQRIERGFEKGILN